MGFLTDLLQVLFTKYYVQILQVIAISLLVLYKEKVVGYLQNLREDYQKYVAKALLVLTIYLLLFEFTLLDLKVRIIVSLALLIVLLRRYVSNAGKKVFADIRS